MPNLGVPELIVIGIIVVFLFGARRIPELASGLGQGIRTFKKALNEEPEKKSENTQQIEETHKAKAS